MKKLFLSHYEKLQHLRAFEQFLKEVILIEPILLEDQDPLGMDPRPRAEHYMRQCEGVIFLLTKDAISGTEFQPRSSVSVEMPIAERIFPPEKRFYMIEEGVSISALAKAPNRINFSWDDPSKLLVALGRIARCLRGEGLAPSSDVLENLRDPDERSFFILEQLAKSPTRWSPMYEFVDLYMKEFGTDQADFNIRTNQLEKDQLVARESALVPSPNRIPTKRSGLTILPRGLEVVEKLRSEEPARFIQGMQKLGLLPKRPESGGEES